MNEINVTGIIISTSPVKEYDRRVVILTKEKGKITAFANGARKPSSPLVGLIHPFSFGDFVLFAGRSSYTVKSVKINHYFEDLRNDLMGAYYGFYFLELTDYYAKEENDERELLKLLYQTLRALINERISNELIRYIFELKSLTIHGMAPNVFSCIKCGSKEGEHYFSVAGGGLICVACMEVEKFDKSSADRIRLHPSTLYTMQFIISEKVMSLYTFQVSEEVLIELGLVMKKIAWFYVDKNFKSLEILEGILLS
ncbi:MAG: DNA repair protein RecO [Lachnospiraceae bacterium]|nr:DNA repair protein RecO [Lachnospiraceae bacterium]